VTPVCASALRVCMCVRARVHVRACARACACVRACMCARACACVRACMCVEYPLKALPTPLHRERPVRAHVECINSGVGHAKEALSNRVPERDQPVACVNNLQSHHGTVVRPLPRGLGMHSEKKAQRRYYRGGTQMDWGYTSHFSHVHPSGSTASAISSLRDRPLPSTRMKRLNVGDHSATVSNTVGNGPVLPKPLNPCHITPNRIESNTERQRASLNVHV
jgi:hypothetical protein